MVDRWKIEFLLGMRIAGRLSISTYVDVNIPERDFGTDRISVTHCTARFLLPIRTSTCSFVILIVNFCQAFIYRCQCRLKLSFHFLIC